VYALPISNATYSVNGTSAATGCSSTATAVVNFTPAPPFVTPNPAYLCIGAPPIKLKVTTPASTVSFCSAPINIPVADNDPAGGANSIIVTGLPLVPISAARVTINMTHTRISDMIFVLQAPNGMVLNLDYRTGSTATTALGTGFTNTIFSSNGTVALSTGANPYTGVFKPDAVIVGSLGAAGPTGMLPTASNFAPLFSVPNGNWKLGFYDAATGETGILNSWCLSFSYNAGSPNPSIAPAVWSPAAGLFMDATAVIPYIAGTAIDSVWAWPTQPGTYTYQVTTKNNSSNCFSPPGNVVVTTSAPTLITTQPVDQNICIGNDAHFSVVAAGTGLSYQWQVTTNGGVTYSNLINIGPYSGVLSPNLTISQPTQAMSGSRFRVIVSGNAACANIASATAILTVNPLPAVSFYPAPYSKLLPGLTTTLYAVVTPNTTSSYTWWHDGVIVPGATTNTYLVDFDHIGVYKLSVTDINGCTNFSDTMSIRDSALGKIFMYPNPSNGYFLLRLYSGPNKVIPLTINVFNNMGTKVLSLPYTQTQSYQQIYINSRQYGKGIYWVELLDKDDKRISISRILVQ